MAGIRQFSAQLERSKHLVPPLAGRRPLAAVPRRKVGLASFEMAIDSAARHRTSNYDRLLPTAACGRVRQLVRTPHNVGR